MEGRPTLKSMFAEEYRRFLQVFLSSEAGGRIKS